MKNLIWLWLLVILFFTGCKTKQVISTNEQHSLEKDETVVNTIHETKETDSIHIEYLPMDSTFFSVLFACDSLNNVYMQQIESLQGDKLKQSFTFDNNKLALITKVDSMAIYQHFKSRYETTVKDSVYINKADKSQVEKETITIEKKVYPKWLLFLALLGVCFSLYFSYKGFICLKSKIIKIPPNT